jgi:hypothetical protein
MANFVQIGSRVVNLDLVCGAERTIKGGPVTLLFSGSGADPLRWEFSEQHEADLIWLKLVPRRGDLTDLEGGPYAITDNEATASTRDATRDEQGARRG